MHTTNASNHRQSLKRETSHRESGLAAIQPSAHGGCTSRRRPLVQTGHPDGSTAGDDAPLQSQPHRPVRHHAGKRRGAVRWLSMCSSLCYASTATRELDTYIHTHICIDIYISCRMARGVLLCVRVGY